MRSSADVPGPSDDDPLAQPTRARLYALLRERRRPATTSELAGDLGLHPNGIRLHLDRLRRAGLVERARPAGGTGRPRDVWSLAPMPPPRAAEVAPYAELSRWLALALAGGGAGPPDVEAVGRAIGRDLAPASDAPPAARIRDALAAMGFAPREADGPPGTWSCRLGHCPYREAAREPTGPVCTLHRGITAGLIDAVAPGARLALFEPREPREAGCLVGVAGLPGTTASPVAHR